MKETEQIKTAEEILNHHYVHDNMMTQQKGWIINAMNSFASQESKRAVDEALIDKDFIVYCLNQAWNYAHEQLQKKDLGDIEREIYQQQKDKAKALMTKLDS